MGKNISKEKKEEVNIAQAGTVEVSGDSNGTTWTIKDIVNLCILILAVLVIAYFIYTKIKKILEKKIRREIYKSREALAASRVDV